MEDLKGKTAIITGGSMGIGRAVALRLAEDGSDIVIADMAEPSALDTVNKIKALGRRAIFCKVDVSDHQQVSAMVSKTLEELQRVDILVCCAGITGPLSSPVHEYELKEWDRIIAVNLTGTFLCCQAVLKPMIKQQSGKIITISSMAAKDGNPGMSGYVASKGAIIAFTKGLGQGSG
jgi:NAD(P)-dependent dehydrogenase (short-subunit alcohol dehydrogenase family)